MLVRFRIYNSRGRDIAINPDEVAMVGDRDDFRCVVITFKSGESVDVEGFVLDVLRRLEDSDA